MSVSNTDKRESAEFGLTLLELLTALLTRRRSVLAFCLGFTLLAGLAALMKGAQYRSEATFVVATNRPNSQAGIRGLASQFGLGDLATLGGGGSWASPSLFVQLAKSTVVLMPVLDDTVGVAQDGGIVRTPLIEMLDVPARDGEPPQSASRLNRGVDALREHLDVSLSRETGAIELGVVDPRPEVALFVAERIIDRLNAFALDASRAQASEERRFVEQRLAEQERTLRAAEDSLAGFLARNREFRDAPSLLFQYERMQRKVALQQQVFLGLAQSNEDVRTRELRDVPVITAVEPPLLAVEPESRHRFLLLSAGAILGLLFGILWNAIAELAGRRLAIGDVSAIEFMRALKAVPRRASDIDG